MITPYKIFSICQSLLGNVRGGEKWFLESHYYGYYCLLLKYFTNDLKMTSIKQIKTFISVCAKNTGSSFSEYSLITPEYAELFNIWYRKNSNEGSYFTNIQECFRNVYKFCSNKGIRSVEEYVSKWGVSHLVSGILDENIAYAMGLGKKELSKPEQVMIGKKFGRHIKQIEERIAREDKLREELEEGLKDLKKKLGWNKVDLAERDGRI